MAMAAMASGLATRRPASCSRSSVPGPPCGPSFWDTTRRTRHGSQHWPPTSALRSCRPSEALLDRWWGIAAIRANPLSEDEQAQVAQANAGDFTGLLARDEQGMARL
jgi:hypothetical protein